MSKGNNSSLTRQAARKSGRPAFDENGRGIWERQTATRVYERTITDAQLKNLAAPDLTLADAESAPQGKLWPTPAARSMPVMESVRAYRENIAPSNGSRWTRLLRRLGQT